MKKEKKDNTKERKKERKKDIKKDSLTRGIVVDTSYQRMVRKIIQEKVCERKPMVFKGGLMCIMVTESFGGRKPSGHPFFFILRFRFHTKKTSRKKRNPSLSVSRRLLPPIGCFFGFWFRGFCGVVWWMSRR